MDTVIMPCQTCTARNVLGSDEIVIVTVTNVKTVAVWTCNMCQTKHEDKITMQGFYFLLSRGVNHKIIRIPAEMAEIVGMVGPVLTEDDLIAFGLALSRTETPAALLV